MNYHSDDHVTLDGVKYRLTSHFGSSWWMTEQAFDYVADRVLMIARCQGEADYCKNAGLDLFLGMRSSGPAAYQVTVKYQKKSSKVDFGPDNSKWIEQRDREIEIQKDKEARAARAR